MNTSLLIVFTYNDHILRAKIGRRNVSISKVNEIKRPTPAKRVASLNDSAVYGRTVGETNGYIMVVRRNDFIVE